MTRRRFIPVFAVAVAACAHRPVPEAPPQLPEPPARFSYDERIQNILISPEKGKLVVLGERYHYVFDDVRLASIMQSSFRQDLVATLGGFRVGPDNRIEGTYSIRLRRQLAGAQLAEARQLGFVPAADGQMELAATIRGLRSTGVSVASAPEAGAPGARYVVNVQVHGFGPGHNMGAAAPSLIPDVFALPLLVIMCIFVSGCPI